MSPIFLVYYCSHGTEHAFYRSVPLLTDGDIIFDPLNKTLFPGLPSSIKVHSGFSGSQARSASKVLAAVKTALAKFGTKKVTVTGHSLGEFTCACSPRRLADM